MDFNELRVNNRVEIECENENPAIRNLKGIVVALRTDSVLIVTDYGELEEIFEESILSINKITFDRIISDSMTEMKEYYNEIYELETKLKDLRSNERTLKSKLYDANFLARFNINGAKNRLDNSIPKDLLNFAKDNLTFNIYFGANPNNQIELHIKVFNAFEYYNLDEIGDIDKIIRVHAPNVKDLIAKCFSFEVKINELDKKVVHDKDSLYNVSTLYKMCIDVSKDNFLDVRGELIKGLQRLKM